LSTVIKVENLSKQYRLGTIGTGTLSHDLNRWWYRIRGKEDPFLKVGEVNDRTQKGSSDYVWALQNINFEVNQGDVLGIIGRNGAGKSTLLKILSRTTSPTTGSVKAKGRIASLLEVGTGFHPELTGRENIFLNGAILGMRKKEIQSKLDEIVDFSGVEKYIDTPVKRYSSGMYVRLAFAVAAHLEPEILIVDEVLAVGDMEFQKKCLGKMKDVSGQGRTVLFVSHNMQAITTLTKNCIFLHQGRILFSGSTREATKVYLEHGVQFDSEYTSEFIDAPKITSVKVITSEPNSIHVNGNSLEIRFQVTTPIPLEGAGISFQIFDSLDIPIVHLWLFDSDMEFCRSAGVFEVVCTIPKFRIYLGKYKLSIHLGELKTGKKLDTVTNICGFEVVMFGKDRDYPWQNGTCYYIEDCSWAVNSITSNAFKNR
jgi:lipopolysaccharide transport system ATP-binding protein